MIGKTLSTVALVFLMLVLFLTSVILKPHWYQGLFERLSWRTSGLVLDIGDVQTSWNPVRLNIRDLQLSNPHWPRPELLSIQKLDLTLTDLPDIAAPFWALTASGIELSVEQDREGRFNWLSRYGQSDAPDELAVEGDDSVALEPAPESAGLPFSLPGDFNFHSVDIQDWTVRWRIAGEQGEAALPRIQLNREAEAQSKLTIDARYREQNINIVGAAKLEKASGDTPSQVNLDLTLSQADVSLSGDGQIVLSPNLAGTAFALEVKAPQLHSLGQMLETEMPPLENIMARGQFSIDDQWRLRQLILQANDQAVSGELNFLPQELKLSGLLKSESLNLDRLIPASDDEDTADSPAETEIDLQLLKQYPVDLRIEIADLNYQNWQLQGLKVGVENGDQLLTRLQLAQLVQTSDDASSGNALQTGPIQAEILVKPRKPVAQGPDIDLQLNASLAEQKLSVAGPVNINGTAGTQLKLSVDGQRSLPLWQLLQQPYAEAGAISIRGDIEIDGERSGQSELQLALGETEIESSSRWQQRSGRMFVRSAIKADTLDLRFMDSDKPDDNSGESNAPAAEGPLFSDENIDFTALRDMDAELDIRVGQIRSQNMGIRGMSASPRLMRGMLTMDQARIDFTTGSAILSMLLNARNDEALLRLDMNVNQVPISVFGIDPSLLGDSGEVNASARLSSTGKSPKQLAAGLAGSIEFQAEDVVVKNNKIDLVGGDIFSETLGKLNPFAKSDPNTHFKCISLAMEGRGGRFESDKKLVLETRKMKIVGAGEIDLGKERLSIGMTPIARKGLGVNAGSLVQMVKLAGPLNNPKVVADASGVLNAGLSTSAAVYTGGLSLIAQGLIKRAMNSGSACKNGNSEPMDLELPEYMQTQQDSQQPASTQNPQAAGA